MTMTRQKNPDFSIEDLQELVHVAPYVEELLRECDDLFQSALDLDDSKKSEPDKVLGYMVRMISAHTGIQASGGEAFFDEIPFEYFFPEGYCRGYRLNLKAMAAFADFTNKMYHQLKPNYHVGMQVFTASLGPEQVVADGKEDHS